MSTNKYKNFEIPIMVLLLIIIFWLTIKGANYPSQLLSDFFGWFEHYLYNFCVRIGLGPLVVSAVVDGIYGMASRVIAVTLPPMAIFFPLFTLLDECGYLPRVAARMDGAFSKCGACGKQCLTMMMGFGCNACGVTGCQMIETRREKLIAILTNCFVPCNGKYPTLIALATILFAAQSLNNTADTASSATSYTVNTGNGFATGLLPVLLLAGLVMLGVFATLLASKLLSVTVLKGSPSEIVLEMPELKKPDITMEVIRSVLGRTFTVFRRAVCASAPAGLILWLLANIHINDVSILSLMTEFLDPFAGLIGMDGVILAAFLLSFPANEMFIPVMLMTYSMSGTLADYGSISEIGAVLASHGHGTETILCMLAFALFHYPCATTLLTIRNETQSFKWTALAFALPTIFGLLLCAIINAVCILLF